MNPKMYAIERFVLFAAARSAISLMNTTWAQGGKLPEASLERLTKIITTAAINGDQAAADWLMLLDWKPQQLRN